MRPVPFHQVPGRAQPEPSWDDYLDGNFRTVRRLVPTLDDALIRDSWTRELDLFFVDRRFNRLRGNVNEAHYLLRSMAGPEQVPSKADINALTEGVAISLLSVCRLRYCLELARRTRHEVVTYFFSLESGIPIVPGQVIPSINVFDADRYRIASEEMGVMSGELTAYVSRAVGRVLNADLFEASLAAGYSAGRGGQSRGFYRLTDYMANSVYGFLQSKAAEKNYPLRPPNYYLPRNPRYGPGHGKWCRSLRRNHGNYWSPSSTPPRPARRET